MWKATVLVVALCGAAQGLVAPNHHRTAARPSLVRVFSTTIDKPVRASSPFDH